jgi:hypothetical protein
MTRYRNSWAIAKRSWAVLKSEKALAWFPVLSFVGCLVAVGALGGLIALIGIDDSSTGVSLQPMGMVLIGVGYLAVAMVQTYCLAGLVAGADLRLRGSDSSFGTALGVANSRLHRLIPWAIVTATVSVILRALEERAGIIGRIVIGIVGLAWSLITFLTIPILVIEDLGVGAALTRSKDLFKKTWGENMIGQGGLGVVGILAVLPGAALIAAGIALGPAGIVVLGGVGLVWALVALVVISALSGIYRTALYHYAASGQVPGDFAGLDFQDAFRPRRAGGFGGLGGGFSQN